MVKDRKKIPKAISEQVLKEFRHRCAVCGQHEPQIHHIDEDPSNNVPENLLPLCPNCHLQDSHDPTSPPDPLKIRLFRRSKDPVVLDPKFHPIWTRLKFLRESDEERVASWEWSCHNLIGFIKALKMGEYYANSVIGILNEPRSHYIVYQKRIGNELSEEDISHDPDLQKEVVAYRATVIEDICVEMLRYQGWSIEKQGSP